MRPRPLHRKLLLPLAAGLLLALPAIAAAADTTAAATPGAATHVAGSPAAAAPAPPRKATAEERAMAERLDPLARAAFWAHEVDVDARDAQAGVRLAAALSRGSASTSWAQKAARVQ